MTSEFSQMQSAVHQNSREKGFWDAGGPNEFAVKCALIHSEVTEAFEAWRKSHDTVPEELADIVIRVMDLAEHEKIDLWKAIVEKHRKNLSRPHMHGGRKC